ncbi:hypothetical protein PRIPAC_79204 [Pristionchus pacificus]|nr:hypothetical protein PRIPAC_79204 [Pristionchus pacificus]
MKYLALLLLVGAAALLEAKEQNVTVKGIAVCNKRKLANTIVELWDRDTLDPNDLLASVHTNGDGEFMLTGAEDEIGSIEPFVRFTHNCNAKPGCSRVADYDIPKDFIGGEYDMTFVVLDIAVRGEKEEC